MPRGRERALRRLPYRSSATAMLPGYSGSFRKCWHVRKSRTSFSRATLPRTLACLRIHGSALSTTRLRRASARTTTPPFAHVARPYFCVLNPDVWWTDDPFSGLLSCLEATRAAVAGPLVIGPDGHAADSIRRFPTILSLLRKGVGGDDGRYQTTFGAACFPADWVAGMCMLFQSADFAAVGGFDEAFFLYYEDVDICARLWDSGRSVAACPKSLVTHSAQRASRHRADHMRRHLASMALYLWKYRGRRPRCSSSLATTSSVMQAGTT